MRKIFIITLSMILILSISIVNVYAIETTKEEELLISIDEQIEGMSSKITEEYYLIKENQEELTAQQNEIIEQIKTLNNTMTIIMFSGIFVILLYFSKSWYKLAVEMINSGRR